MSLNLVWIIFIIIDSRSHSFSCHSCSAFRAVTQAQGRQPAVNLKLLNLVVVTQLNQTDGGSIRGHLSFVRCIESFLHIFLVKIYRMFRNGED